MFGLNMWVRPFAHPSVVSPGTDGSHYLPPAFPAAPWMLLASGRVPGMHDKGALPPGHPAAGGHGFPLTPEALAAEKSALADRPFFLHGLKPPTSTVSSSLLAPGQDSRGVDGKRTPSNISPLRPASREDTAGAGEGREGPEYPSAFLPPAKRARLQDTHPHLPHPHHPHPHHPHFLSLSPRDGAGAGREEGRGGSPRGSGSPRSLHSSHLDSDSDDLRSAHSVSPHPTFWRPDDRRPAVKLENGRVICPVCGEELKAGEISAHFAKEMDIFLSEYARRRTVLVNHDKETVTSQDQSQPEHTETEGRPIAESISPPRPSDSRYETFLKIKNNRQDRLKVKAKLRRKRPDLCDDQSMHNTSGDSTSSHLQVSDLSDPTAEVEIDVVSMGEAGDATAAGQQPGCGETQTQAQAEDGPPTNLRCSICTKGYKKPVTSIQCWHVYCEGCWLQALGSTHMCPQCKTVTSPADLRNVFI